MIADPPVPFPDVNLQALQAGTVLHRLHVTGRGGDAFNPCLGRPARFSPIYAANGDCVPTLYAASSFESAVFESVFHEIPIKAARKSVKKQDIDDRAHSLITLRRDVSVVTIYAPDLLLWNMERSELVDTSPMHYARTARWAEAIYRACPDAAGLAWTSRKCDPHAAYVFFGDRLRPGDVDATLREDAGSAKLLSEIRDLGKRAGIVITV